MDDQVPAKETRKRSIYTRMATRAFVCGYLLVVCILLKFNAPSFFVMNLFRVYYVVAIVSCIYFIRVPIEVEDEMVQKLYARANAWADGITQVGLLIFLCLIGSQQRFIISSGALLIFLSALMFLVAILRIVIVYICGKRGL